jgi:2'-5' RNA ligase
MRTGPRTVGLPPPQSGGACNLFFGVFPPHAVREAMAAEVARLRERAPVRGRWSDPRRYHVTVQFLGQAMLGPDACLDSPPLAAMRAAAGQVRVPTFDLCLDTTGAFGRSRVGWLGCTQPPAGLLELWRQLGAALDARGVPRDAAPSWVPHVTVLRDARDGWPVQPVGPIPWRVSELVLARSHPGRPGAYEPLQAWPLV